MSAGSRPAAEVGVGLACWDTSGRIHFEPLPYPPPERIRVGRMLVRGPPHLRTRRAARRRSCGDSPRTRLTTITGGTLTCGDMVCRSHHEPSLNSARSGVRSGRMLHVGAQTRRVGRTRHMPWRGRWRVVCGRHGHQREPQRRTRLDERSEQESHIGADGGFVDTGELGQGAGLRISDRTRHGHGGELGATRHQLSFQPLCGFSRRKLFAQTQHWRTGQTALLQGQIERIAGCVARCAGPRPLMPARP